MWDCFDNQIPILCPNIQPFKYYIEKYNIGYCYDNGNLLDIMLEISSINKKVINRYKEKYLSLIEDYSFSSSLRRMIKIIENIK